MAAIAGILIIIGYILAFVGGIMIIVAAFKTSVVWGLLTLLIPGAALVFVIMKWQEGKKGFLISLGGTGVIILGFVLAIATAEPEALPSEPPATTEPAPQ